MQPLDYATPQPRRRALWPHILLAIGIILLAISVFIRPAIRYSPSDSTKDASNLRMIGQAMLLHANNCQGKYPDHIDALVEFLAPESLVSPYSTETPAKGPTTQAIVAQLNAGGHLSYVYCGGGFTTAASADTVFAYGPPIDSGRNFLFGDGHVEWDDSKQTKYLLSELAAGHNPPRPLSSATAP
jgi:prepilin-type processing-associated H-X9-DG protein